MGKESIITNKKTFIGKLQYIKKKKIERIFLRKLFLFEVSVTEANISPSLTDPDYKTFYINFR